MGKTRSIKLTPEIKDCFNKIKHKLIGELEIDLSDEEALCIILNHAIKTELVEGVAIPKPKKKEKRKKENCQLLNPKIVRT